MLPIIQSRSARILACVLPASFLSAIANAQSYTNDTGGSVTFYGQFSPTGQFFDDGVDSYSNLADNSNSNSRVGFNLDQELNNGQKLRFKFETALAFPGTSEFNQLDDDPEWNWERSDIRKVEVIWSGNFGALSLGQGSMATDGSAGADFSGVTMTGTAQAPDTAGGFFFRDDVTKDTTDIAIDDVFDDFDGSRRFRVRYDTPALSGFSAAFAYGSNALSETDEDIYYDVALNYGNAFGDFEMEGSLGYAWRDRDEGDTDENWVGSFAILHTLTGINGVVAAGGEDGGGTYTYVKAGWIGNFWSVGSSNFAVDYYTGSDFDSDGSDSETWGLHYTQNFDDLNLEAYLGWRAYAFEDDSGMSYRDASSVLAGARWKF